MVNVIYGWSPKLFQAKKGRKWHQKTKNNKVEKFLGDFLICVLLRMLRGKLFFNDAFNILWNLKRGIDKSIF